MADKSRKTVTAVVLFGVAAGMVGLSFASVPLYRLFCQTTGFGGTPRTENVVLPAGATEQRVAVQFDANTNSRLPWDFAPVERRVNVRLGEEVLVHFSAHNRGDKPMVGTATFNVVPEKVAQYFNKIQCFCFSEQLLEPGQTVDMPVTFFVDPAMADDPDTQDVSVITLSYTFYPAGEERQPDAGNGSVAGIKPGASGS